MVKRVGDFVLRAVGNHGHVFIREGHGLLCLAGERLKRKGNRKIGGHIALSALWGPFLPVESLWNELLPGLSLAHHGASRWGRSRSCPGGFEKPSAGPCVRAPDNPQSRDCRLGVPFGL